MLVTNQAPDFTATAVIGKGEIVEGYNLYENMGKNGAVLFFYPLDFTFVCPSEIIAFGKRAKDFEDRGIAIIGVSVDSQFSHHAWKNVPVNKGGIEGVEFPLIADLDKQISKDYDVLLDGAVALRGSFLIDANKIIRHATINDLPIGRNVDEMLRTIDAMQFTDTNGDVCPAGWTKGDAAMTPDANGVASYLADHEGDL